MTKATDRDRNCIRSRGAEIPAEGIDRILAETKLSYSEDTRQLAISRISKNEIARNFDAWQGAYVHNKNPSDALKDVKSARKHCAALLDLLEGERTWTPRKWDFRINVLESMQECPKGTIPDIDDVTQQVSRFCWVLNATEEQVALQVGGKAARERDGDLDWLVNKLAEDFETIFKRSPTVNNRPAEGGGHNTPFLRFAAQTMREIALLGYDIKPASMTVDAIRKRFNQHQRIKAKRDKSKQEESE